MKRRIIHMFEITIKDNEFSYDMKALSMAFCPEYPCTILFEDKWKMRDGYTVACRLNGEILWEEFIPAPYTKNLVKQVVYRHFQNFSSKSLPWGILTGIRPAKIPLRHLMDGMTEVEILDILKEEYYMEDSKCQLAIDIAKKEYELTKNIDYQHGYSIYIGVPFCPTRCHYCSFTAYPIGQYQKQTDAYLMALKKEIEYVSHTFSNRELHSIYVGGGTPTSLSEKQLESLLLMIHEHFEVEKLLEFTVEAGRPDSINEEKLKLMRQYGVTRISINPQTMQLHTLERMGRHHSVESIYTVFEQARELGFDNINMDLIAGLPGETIGDFDNTISQIGKLNPDSITIHTLVIKRASRLREEQVSSGEEIAEEAVEIPLMQQSGQDFAYANGYFPYYMYRQKNKAGTTKNTNQENVAYAKEKKECLYNIFIMEELETILALGAGGSSKFVLHKEGRMERVENVKSVEDYISRIDEMIERKEKFLSENEL